MNYVDKDGCEYRLNECVTNKGLAACKKTLWELCQELETADDVRAEDILKFIFDVFGRNSITRLVKTGLEMQAQAVIPRLAVAIFKNNGQIPAAADESKNSYTRDIFCLIELVCLTYGQAVDRAATYDCGRRSSSLKRMVPVQPEMVPGAILTILERLTPQFAQRLARVLPETELGAYCSKIHSVLAANVAQGAHSSLPPQPIEPEPSALAEAPPSSLLNQTSSTQTGEVEDQGGVSAQAEPVPASCDDSEPIPDPNHGRRPRQDGDDTVYMTDYQRPYLSPVDQLLSGLTQARTTTGATENELDASELDDEVNGMKSLLHSDALDRPQQQQDHAREQSDSEWQAIMPEPQVLSVSVNSQSSPPHSPAKRAKRTAPAHPIPSAPSAYSEFPSSMEPVSPMNLGQDPCLPCFNLRLPAIDSNQYDHLIDYRT